MLGIDVGQEEIRVVNLRRRGGSYHLRASIKVPVGAAQADDALELGKLLARAVAGQGWSGQRAVMTLGWRQSFVRNFTSEVKSGLDVGNGGQISKALDSALLESAREMMLVPQDQMVMDIWRSSSVSARREAADEAQAGLGSVLVAAARKEAVSFHRQLAESCGLRVTALESRSLAAINGLLQYWQESVEENIAVVFMEDDHADVAVFDCNGLVVLQTVNVDLAEVGGERIVGELLGNLQRIFNTSRLSEGSCYPERVFLGAGTRAMRGVLWGLSEALTEQAQSSVAVTLCSDVDSEWEGIGGFNKEDEPEAGEYVPATGAALDGMRISPVWFDFFHPRGARQEKKHAISWKPFVLMAVAAMVMFGGFWLNLVQKNQRQIRQLEDAVNQTQPELLKIDEARAKWLLFRSYLPKYRGGNRRAYLEILAEISQACPSTEEAYVTKLDISDRGSDRVNYDIVISGKVSAKGILDDFMKKLSASPMFQDVKQDKELAVNLREEYYQFSFSITCKLRSEQLVGKVTSGE
ncbi:MAG: hypothetical protein JXD22_15520 [Sedimentisphaerales bacterium]|nr:hypothetical protein [Sedimentisphaerales bacterium]